MKILYKLITLSIILKLFACSEIKEIPALENNLEAPIATMATEITETSFQANWEAVSGAVNYVVEVATDDAFTNFVTGYENKVANNLFLQVVGLSAGTTYYYRLRAVNNIGGSDYSNVITVTTLNTAPPTLDAPIATDATNITETSFQANWNMVTGATSYLLDVATDNAFTNFVTGYNAKDISANFEVVTGLSPNTEYFYRVRAKNATLTSAYSNIISVTTSSVIPIFTFTTTAWSNGGAIPDKYASVNAMNGNGENYFPGFTWTNIPAGTQSFAIVVTDLNFTTWLHGAVYNIPASMTSNAEVQIPDSPGTPASVFPFGVTIESYQGPWPPDPHDYEYKIYALDTMLPAVGILTRANLMTAMAGHILGEASHNGTYTP